MSSGDQSISEDGSNLKFNSESYFSKKTEKNIDESKDKVREPTGSSLRISDAAKNMDPQV